MINKLIAACTRTLIVSRRLCEFADRQLTRQVIEGVHRHLGKVGGHVFFVFFFVFFFESVAEIFRHPLLVRSARLSIHCDLSKHCLHLLTNCFSFPTPPPSPRPLLPPAKRWTTFYKRFQHCFTSCIRFSC